MNPLLLMEVRHDRRGSSAVICLYGDRHVVACCDKEQTVLVGALCRAALREEAAA